MAKSTSMTPYRQPLQLVGSTLNKLRDSESTKPAFVAYCTSNYGGRKVRPAPPTACAKAIDAYAIASASARGVASYTKARRNRSEIADYSLVHEKEVSGKITLD